MYSMKPVNDLWEHIWQGTRKMGKLEGKGGALESGDAEFVLLAKNPHTYHISFFKTKVSLIVMFDYI